MAVLLEPGGSDRTVAQDAVLATGQAALTMINGSMVDQSLKNDERWINGRSIDQGDLGMFSYVYICRALPITWNIVFNLLDSYQ